ncbi:hypothetical protein V1460_05495 [Streptomyces sp. SCSIO 30461]
MIAVVQGHRYLVEIIVPSGRLYFRLPRGIGVGAPVPGGHFS